MIITSVEKTAIKISKVFNHFIGKFQSREIPFLIRIGLVQRQKRQDQTGIVFQVGIMPSYAHRQYYA